jgi:hypothetical protein
MTKEEKEEKEEYEFMKNAIQTDIRREIQLAKRSQTEQWKSTCKEYEISEGGGNILAALGLLCYTEAFGNIFYNRNGQNNKPSPRSYFEAMFDLMGGDYKIFRSDFYRKEEISLFDAFRNGMAHSFGTKVDSSISMLEEGSQGKGCAFSVAGDGYKMCVETYFKHLLGAIEKLEEEGKVDRP